MARLPIPSDWNPENDGYCTMSLSVPNSQLWRAIARGKIDELRFNYAWDVTTGDVVEATDEAILMLDSIEFDCMPIVPIQVAYGSIVAQEGNTYTINSQTASGKERVRVRINYINPSGYVDANIYAVTIDKGDYIPDDPSHVITARDRSDVIIEHVDEMNEYCAVDFGRIDMIADLGDTFTIGLTVGPLCP